MKLMCVRIDGGITIETIIRPKPPEQTDEDFAAEVIAELSSKHSYTRIEEINDTSIPNREFRNAWVHTGSAIGIDCAKAKDIALSQLRARRNKLLSDTDVEVTKEMEAGAVSQVTKDRRAALRNATEGLKAIDAAGKIDDEAILAAIRAERDKEL